MSDVVPTVHIKSGNGPVMINLTDFDKEKGHVLASQEEIAEAKEAVEKANTKQTPTAADPEAPKAISIGNNGLKGDKRKFILLDQNETKFGDQQYDTEADAFAALSATVKTE